MLIGTGVALVIIGLLGWLVLSSRGGTTGPLAEKHTFKVSLTATECGGGYDIENAAVEIRDEKDKLIGAGTTAFDVSDGAWVQGRVHDHRRPQGELLSGDYRHPQRAEL
jgi:hypothetical protein